MSLSVEQLAERANIRSFRLLERLVEEVCASLPGPLREFAENRTLSDQWDEEFEYVFPPLTVSPAVGEWQERGGSLLSFKTPELGLFETLNKKAVYYSCVKVSHLSSLAGIRASRWTEFFDPDSSPKGCWRSLYKAPCDKRTGDLQWRIVHGAIATNRHLVHIDPDIGEDCPFCSAGESLQHLFIQCPRLGDIFNQLEEWLKGLGTDFSFKLFIYGPRYAPMKKSLHVLLNYLSGVAKLSIWKTRKNCIQGLGSVDPLLMMRGLLAARLKLEFAYYKLTDNVYAFMNIWGIGGVLCSLQDDLLMLHF